MEAQGGSNSQTILKKNKVGRLTLSNFKLTTKLQNNVVLAQRQHRDQEKTESRNLSIYGQMIFDKDAKTIKQGKGSRFNK